MLVTTVLLVKIKTFIQVKIKAIQNVNRRPTLQDVKRQLMSNEWPRWPKVWIDVY